MSPDVCKMHSECLKGPFTLIWWSWLHHVISPEDIAFHAITVCNIKLDNGGHHYGNMGCQVFKRGLGVGRGVQNWIDFCQKINIPEEMIEFLEFV